MAILGAGSCARQATWIAHDRRARIASAVHWSVERCSAVLSPSARAADGARADRGGDRCRIGPHAALVFDLEGLIGVADRFRGAGWNVQGLAAGIGEAFPGPAICGVRVMQWSAVRGFM